MAARSTAQKLIFAPAGGKASPQADQYTKGTLVRSQLNTCPFKQFHEWFKIAQEARVHQPETVCFSTAALPSGRVSSRYVYLKELDERGFIIYSNWGTSRKAADIASNSYASLAFWWQEQERQVRVEGTVERITAAEGQRYYDLRARGSRIGAWASPQSSVLPEGQGQGGRDLLDQEVQKTTERFEGVDNIPIPDFWGGLRIVPDMFEFWQGRDSRLHDRFQYRKETQKDDEWKIERLAP